MSDLEKILGSHKMGLERQTKLLAKRVKDLGYDGLTDQEFSVAIADNYFGSQCLEQHRDHHGDISDRLFDCCYAIIQIARNARPIKTPLKRSLDELEFLITARLSKRGPPSTRTISAQTLQLLAGFLPKSLAPTDGVRLQDEFEDGLFENILAGPVRMREAEPSKGSPKTAKNFIVPKGSKLVSGITDFYSASDRLIGFAPRAARPWPTSLTKLGFQCGHPVTRDISIGSILKLPPQQLEDLRTRCELTLQELRTRFGIENRYDPLDIGAAAPFVQALMVKLLNCLCDLISPFPDIAELEAYDIIYIAPGRSVKSGKARESALYPLIYQHIKDRLGLPSRQAADAMRFVGLFDPGDGDNAECDRYIQRYIACHRQLAIMSAVGGLLERVLAKVEFASEKAARVPGCDVRVTWSDLQNLGRWSEHLRGRLRCGVVDRGRPQNTRAPIPPQIDWKWPSGLRVNQTLVESVGPLVRAARIASRTALGKQPA
jgi:hypothetical protein